MANDKQTKAVSSKKTPAVKMASAGKGKATAAPKKTVSVKKEIPAKKSTPAKKAIFDQKTISAIRPAFLVTDAEVEAAFQKAIAAADAKITSSKAKVFGKYEFELQIDGYHFYLSANNGQLLLDSPAFTTLLGALNGIKTFQKAVALEPFVVKADKYKRFRFILANKYYGENYPSRDKCINAVESVQNFADCARIIPYSPGKEALRAFEKAKKSLKSPDSVNWAKIEKAEASAEKTGKFEICCEGEDYCFYLLANNGHILYSSRYFSNEAACRKGVESFKKAVYIGNFFVDCDKFGNYRYILKNIGSAPSFIGESYTSRQSCESSIESVKKFVVTASVVLSED